MHPCQGNLVAIGRAVVHYAWVARAFSAGIKCRHSSRLVNSTLIISVGKPDGKRHSTFRNIILVLSLSK